MPKISAENAVRYLMGLWVLGTLATLFWCIVMTPVILVIGSAGKFWLVWNAICRSSRLGVPRNSGACRYSHALDMAADNREYRLLAF
jgi:hypothetical protein